MKVSSKYIFPTLFCILHFLLMPHNVSVWGQQKNAMEEYRVDSILYKYYLRCKAEISSPVIMQMADTLFQMAGEKHDLRMQAVALPTNWITITFEVPTKTVFYTMWNL